MLGEIGNHRDRLLGQQPRGGQGLGLGRAEPVRPGGQSACGAKVSNRRDSQWVEDPACCGLTGVHHRAPVPDQGQPCHRAPPGAVNARSTIGHQCRTVSDSRPCARLVQLPASTGSAGVAGTTTGTWAYGVG